MNRQEAIIMAKQVMDEILQQTKLELEDQSLIKYTITKCLMQLEVIKDDNS